MSASHPQTPDPMALATEQLATVPTPSGPDGAVSAVKNAKNAVLASIASAKSYTSELASIQEQADRGTLLPHGVKTLREEATEKAEAAKAQHRNQLDANLAVAEAELVNSLTPTLTSDTQHSLARQSLDLVVGDAEGKSLEGRLQGLASEPKADWRVIALTGDPYFRHFLLARGVPNADAVIRDLQVTAAKNAGRRPGASQLEAERADVLGKLEEIRTAHMAADLAWNMAS